MLQHPCMCVSASLSSCLPTITSQGWGVWGCVVWRRHSVSVCVCVTACYFQPNYQTSRQSDWVERRGGVNLGHKHAARLRTGGWTLLRIHVNVWRHSQTRWQRGNHHRNTSFNPNRELISHFLKLRVCCSAFNNNISCSRCFPLLLWR